MGARAHRCGAEEGGALKIIVGPFILFSWPVVERFDASDGIHVIIYRPESYFVRDQIPGVIRWSLRIGYVELRRMER